jgi:hypothetical protein
MPDIITNTPPLAPYPAGLIPNAGLLGTTNSSQIADLQLAAQLGFGPNLPQIDGATPLTLSPIVPIVMHSPTMFDSVQFAHQTLKALVERHPKDISGIDFGYQLDTATTPVGHDGQEIHMPTNSKRTQVTPTFTWQELQGNLIWNFIMNWIKLTKHPDTQASLMAALNPSLPVSPFLMSAFTMTVLFIQFDSTMRPENIIDGFFVTNMFPTETGLGGWKRQIGQTAMPERQVAFTGLVQHNRNTKAVAQVIAQALGLHRVNYEFAVPAFANIDPIISDLGLSLEAQIDLGQTALDNGTGAFGSMDPFSG